MRVLIVDNHDSFTFNLFQLIAKVTGVDPIVIENGYSEWRQLLGRSRFDAVVISPGPGVPSKREDFGICLDVILECELPLLGVCLGHQGLGHAHGATVRPAAVPMHGRLSKVTHDQNGLFEGVPQGFDAVRYHSLCLDPGSLPAALKATAWADDGTIMGVQHVSRPQFGVQFHPEAICTQWGERLIGNFLSHCTPDRQLAATSSATSRQTTHRSGAECERTTTRHLVWRRVGWSEPQDAFDALFSRSEYAFWLDSAQIVAGYSRFTMMGDASGPGSAVLLYTAHDRLLRIGTCDGWQERCIESLWTCLREWMARKFVHGDASLPFDFQCGLVGCFGYELRHEVGSPSPQPSGVPDAAVIDPDKYLVFDHVDRCVYLVAKSDVDAAWFDDVEAALRAPRRRPPTCARGEAVIASLADGPKQYCRKVREVQRELCAGETYEVMLSSEFTTRRDICPYGAYVALRTLNPAPYAAFLKLAGFAVLSSSPERFVKVSAGRAICAKPIKGTAPRGHDELSDRRMIEWLPSDEKSRSENMMIVDLLRNDIGRVAETGSVDVPKLMDVESYRTVHQLVSTVTGTLKEDQDIFDCIIATFPGGSMTGAPKKRTMTIIDRIEKRPRGPYAGAIGFLSHGDRMDLNIVIRTIVMLNSTIRLAAGGGIVTLSNPEDEFEEMLLKARAPLAALAMAATNDPSKWKIAYQTD